MFKQKYQDIASDNEDSYEFIALVSSIGTLNTDSPYSSRKVKNKDTASRRADREKLESIVKRIVKGFAR